MKLNKKFSMLALPLEYKLINKNDEFMGLQKLFVFKSKSSDIIIMLQVNYSGSNYNKFTSSFNYSKELFNSKDSKYGEFYNENINDVSIATNSFNYSKTSFNTLCFSNSNDYEKVNEELMSFSNKLINFLVK